MNYHQFDGEDIPSSGLLIHVREGDACEWEEHILIGIRMDEDGSTVFCCTSGEWPYAQLIDKVEYIPWTAETYSGQQFNIDGKYYTPLSWDDRYVSYGKAKVNSAQCEWRWLLDHATQLDGSPCGEVVS